MGISLRVLIVEDSEDDAILLIRMLRQKGYEPIYQRVYDAHSLSAQLDEATWDVIVSDYAMPNFDGLSALEIMKQKNLDLPFIIVSGVIGEETAVGAMRAGAHDYVMKGNLKRLVPAIERELREAEARRARRVAEEEVYKLSRALAQSASLIMITNTLGTIEYINFAFARVTGFDINDLIGQRWNILLFKEDDSDTEISLAHAVSTLSEWHGEFHTFTKAGVSLWLALGVSPIKNANNIASQLLFVAEDITVRKKLELELLHYNEQLELMVKERTSQLQHAKEQTEIILNATNDAIVLALPNGDIQISNPAFERIFGDQVKHSIENLLWSMADDQCIDLMSNAFVSVIYEQQDQRIEASIITEDNKKIDGDIVFVPIVQQNEKKAGLVFSLRDITPLKELERFKERFVASATHDLSNPIAALKTRLYLLERTPEHLEKHVEVFKKQINRLENLVEELRMLSQLDQGKMTLNPEALELNKLIGNVVEAQQPLAAAKQQTIEFQPEANLPIVSADSRKIERVIVNLVANAVNYTPVGGKIELVTYSSPDSIIFSIRDTGIGIGEEDILHIFERFYRTNRAQKSDQPGTGLGLAIVKEMVELHKGTIHVSSKLDIGTLFTITLPRNK